MTTSLAGRDFGLGILTGCVITVVLLLIGFWALSRTNDTIYGLGHWKLSVRTPFESMWMNLGYW